MVKQITFKNLYQMDKFPFIAALFDPQNISFSNRQQNKNYSDFNIPIKRHRHRMLSFFLLFLHVQPKGDTCMNKNVWTPMNNPSHIKICKSYRYSRR